MGLTTAGSVANSIDPDQTPLGLYCLLKPVFPNIVKFRYYDLSKLRPLHYKDQLLSVQNGVFLLFYIAPDTRGYPQTFFLISPQNYVVRIH